MMASPAGEDAVVGFSFFTVDLTTGVFCVDSANIKSRKDCAIPDAASLCFAGIALNLERLYKMR